MPALQSVPVKAALWVLLFGMQVALMLFFVTDEDVHEYLGIGYGLLAAAHLWIARWWWVTLPAAAKNPASLVNAAVSLGLLAALFAALLSGLLLSRYAVPFLRYRPWLTAMRSVHLVSTFWLLMLVLVHAGLHGTSLIHQCDFCVKSACVRWALWAALALLSAVGLTAFFELGLPNYLFWRTRYYAFDSEISAFFYVASFLCIAVLTATLSWAGGKLLRSLRKKR